MQIDILYEDDRWEAAGLGPLAKRAAEATLLHLGIVPDEWEVSLLACDDENVFAAPSENADVFVVDIGDGSDALTVCTELRAGGIRAERSWDQRSMKAQMKAANRSGARFAVLIGESEREAGTALIRDLRSDDEQLSVARADLTGTLISRLSSLQGASS